MKKKSILCSILMLCMMLLGTMGFAQTIVFSEDFSGFSDSTTYDLADQPNELDAYTNLPGWSGSKVNQCYGKIKLGTSSAKGWIQTPTIDLSGNGGNFTLEFDADAWYHDATTIYVYLDNTSYEVSDLDNSGNYGAYGHYTLSLSGGTSTSHIRFEGKQASKARFFLDNLVITQNGGTPTVAQPTFSHESGIYTSPFNLTITSTTENASIYYTLDGTTPTTVSELYTEPITISQSTTVKAIATAEGLNNSSVATATYTFPYVANIAEFKSQTNTSQLFTITNDVTYVFGQGAYTYVRDASAGLLIYGNNAVTGFNEGDQISNLTGKKTVFNGQIEMTNTVAPDSATSNTGTVTPVVVTMSELLANYSSYDAQLVTIENVTFPDGFSGSTIKFGQGTDSLTLYNRFGIDTVLEAGATTNITGFVAIYNSQKQIYPRYNSDLSSQAPVLLPSLTITAPANGSTFGTLDTLPIGVNIQNFELGTDGYLKVETPLLTTIGLTNPAYLDQTGLNMLLATTLSPLPAGTQTITCSLVDMNQMALNPAVTATTTFTVTAPALEEPYFSANGIGVDDDPYAFYFNATITIMAEDGATIHYTTDGSTPTTESLQYTTPFLITETTTVKAIAVKEHYQNSPVAMETFTIIIPTVETPVFAPVAGTYADSVVFSIACATEDVEIRYTTDGTEPTVTSTLYTAPVTLTATTTVKAKAFKTDWTPSETVTAIYTVVYDPVLTVDATTLNFTSTTLTQTFTVSGAHLNNAITLTCDNTHFMVNPTTISASNSNTLVTVTFDGTEPATGNITVVSDTLSAQVALTATAQLPAPVLDPANGVDTLITVTMSCTVAGADIHYTTDGTDPTAASATYNAPVALNIPGTYTVKAIAVKEGWENSEVTTGTYIINEPPAPQPLDTVIYAIGFEASEGFAATDVYNNTDIAYSGPAGQQWGTFYGTPSTTSPITGSQSMHMRWYTSAVSNVGYTFTNFDLHNVTHVTFLAKNSNGLNVRVSHSIDGGITYSIGEVFSVGSTAQAFDYVVDENGSNDFVRLKFSIELPETNPSSTSRLYLDSVAVYGIPGLAPSMASIPTITPNSGFFYDPQTVSITCETEDAVIRYTTDGSEPTETSTTYTEPFQVSATTTIKAKAWKTDLAPSFTAIANISFPEQVENIAQFKANASNEPQQIMSDVTFLFRNGRYIFVEDNSAAMLIYDNSNPVITTEYNEGDVIQGGIFGRYTLYNGMVEMVPTHNAAEATGTPVTVTPTVATVANVINDYAYATIYESKLVRINDVVFIDAETFVQNGDTMSIRDRFNTVDLEINAGDQADVIGFVCYSNDRGYHIYPRDNNDINIHPVVVMDTVATPVIVVNNNDGSYSMHISCATDGATIHYTLDGSTPDENDEVFTADLQLPVNQLTLKAIAVKDGMVNSAIAVYNYNPTGIEQFELRDRLNLYPNPADNYVMIGAKDGGITIEKVELYNMFGQLLRSVEVNGTAAELSVSSLATGSYIAKVFTDKGVTTLSMIRK